MKKLILLGIMGSMLQIISCTSFQWAYDLDGIEEPFFLWLKEGEKFEMLSNKNDTTIFTITYIERRKGRFQMNIPILGGGDLLHKPTNIYIHCAIMGDTTSIQLKTDRFVGIDKFSKSPVIIAPYFGNEYGSGWTLYSDKIIANTKESEILTFSTPFTINRRTFMDTENIQFYQIEDTIRGIVSYIWSKHYGLLQYTTADSLVWTRINIEEPEEK